MRVARTCLVVTLLLAAASDACAQVGIDDSPSLLPLPSFSPPMLPSGPMGPLRRPAGLRSPAGIITSPARMPPPGRMASPAGMPRSVAASFAQGETIPPPYANGPRGWDQPTEALPSVAPDFFGAGPAGGCGTCGSGAPVGCAPCAWLGGSPYAAAFNTYGVPPLNLYGLSVRPGFWFGSLAGLIMTRDLPNAVSTTYNSTNVNTNLLDTAQARPNWAGGGQVMFGRWFGPQAYGWQFIYWGVGPMLGSAAVIDPNYQLSTPFNLGNVSIGQQSATFYFDHAHEHALWRSDGFSNFEWNAMRRGIIGGCCSRLMFTGLAGVRYFRFQDGLIFGGVNADHFSDAGGAYAAYLNTGVTNSLVGFQFGTRIDYFILPRVRLYAQPMIGFFGNQVTMREHLYSGDGAQGFDVRASRSTVSTLGQIDLGAGYQVTPRFAIFAAYRLIGVTRVGLADNQIPAFWADQQGMQHIKTNGDLILHGVMMGGLWNY